MWAEEGPGEDREKRQRGLTRNHTCWLPEHGLPASGTDRKRISVVKPPSLWHFVTEAQTNQHSQVWPEHDMAELTGDASLENTGNTVERDSRTRDTGSSMGRL